MQKEDSICFYMYELDKKSYNSRAIFELTEVKVYFVVLPSITKSMWKRGKAYLPTKVFFLLEECTLVVLRDIKRNPSEPASRTLSSNLCVCLNRGKPSLTSSLTT